MERKLNLVLLCLLIVLNACNQTLEQASAETIAKKSYIEKLVVKVQVAKVRKGDFSLELVSNGKLMAKRKAIVPFKVQEQILQVAVKNGQKVKRGELLARVDPYQYKKRLHDSRQNYEKACLDLEDQLLGYGYNVSDTAQIADNILKMLRIRSGYDYTLSNLKEAERNFTFTNITAPIDGTVANLEAHVFNPSNKYKQCCEVIDDAIMVIEFGVMEGEVKQVKIGQEVELKPFALQNQTFKGRVVALNPCVDEHGMILVQAEVKNTNHLLMDGMNTKVLVRNKQENKLIIPKSAVLYRQNRKVVFVYEDGLAKWVYVEVGDENYSEVSLSGDALHMGQKVIISNNLNLAHGSPVVVKGQKTVVKRQK